GYGVGVIVPRLRVTADKKKSWKQWICEFWTTPKPTQGWIFWDQIMAFQDAADWQAAFNKSDSTQLLEAVTSHQFVLSQIAQEKYRCVKLSIFFAILGTAAAIVLILATAGTM